MIPEITPITMAVFGLAGYILTLKERQGGAGRGEARQGMARQGEEN